MLDQIKKGGAVLGRNLARIQQKTKKVIRADKQEGYLHTTDLQDGYDWGRLNLASVTEEDSYQDFLNTAELAGRDFDAEKWNVKLLDAQNRQVYIDTGPVEVAHRGGEDPPDPQEARVDRPHSQAAERGGRRTRASLSGGGAWPPCRRRRSAW